MMSVEGYYFSENPGSGNHHFPCWTHEGYAVALLDVLPKEIECVLDITDLIDGGWTNAFDDLVEFQQAFAVMMVSKVGKSLIVNIKTRRRAAFAMMVRQARKC